MDVSKKQRFVRRIAVLIGLMFYGGAWLVTLERLRDDDPSIRFRDGVFIQDYWVSDWGNIAILIILAPVGAFAAYKAWRR